MRRKEEMKHKSASYLAAIGLLMVLFALLIFGSQRVSITTDEMAYVAEGYALLAQGKEALWAASTNMSPPLLNVIEASLVYMADPNLSVRQMAGWGVWWRSFVADFAFQVFRVERAEIGWYRFDPPLAPSKYTPPASKIVQSEMAARIPIMLLTVLLGAIVFRWGKDIWGPTAGLLALFVLTFDPTLLAHGRLSTTDVGLTTFGTAALYMAWRWTARPSWRRALGTGALLGATLLVKSSGVLWTTAAGLVLIGNMACRRDREEISRFLIQGAAAAGLSLLLIWACYGFTWGPVKGLPISLPAPAYWEAFQAQALRSSHWVFALGIRKLGHWWWYQPLAFLIKNPLPFLLSLVVGAISLSSRPFAPRQAFTLAVFPILYAGASLKWGVNIGYRYLLPIHPLLYLLIAGGLSHLIENKAHWQRWLVGALLIWQAVETVSTYPNEIAYFNQLVGGPRGGYRYLSDSNVEWGQSSHVLYEYAREHPDVQIKRPAYKLLPSPGRYLVNATQLQGMNIDDPFAYEWFRHREPVGRVSDTLLLYDVPPRELAWFAQCDIPAIPLDEAAVLAGIGPMNWREVEFDCRQAWLYPFGGAQSGIYALHHDLTRERGMSLPSLLRQPPALVDSFIGRHLNRASLSFEHEISDAQSPAFLLYDMPAAAPVPPRTLAYPTVAETAPASLSNSRPVSAPLTLGPLVFLGATAYRDGDSLDVETWWQATSEPITRPLSIMAHLLTAQGATLQVRDGLGVSPQALQAGDIVVQRHRFSRPPQGTALWLRTGAYWLDTSKRLPITNAPEADAIFIKLIQ
jgi:4-amino-4-deoxy-L-arabinose transferase-like glycosyltransferase